MRTMLKTLCEASGVGGVGTVGQIITDMLCDYADEIVTDPLGNIVAWHHSDTADAPVVMLEAHMDEIGFVVTEIDDQGYIHVAACGGVDSRVLAAAPVTVLCDPPLDGVFCSTPPHLADKNDEIKPLADMGIDVGLTPSEVNDRVSLGTRVAFASPFRAVGEHTVCTKALDNRAGCAAVITAFQMLCLESLPFHIAAMFAVQEEIGGAGALTGAFSTEPTVAIVTDVSFAYTPDAPAHECGVFGEGPMLGVAPGLDRSLIEKAKTAANSLDIPLQYEVMGGSTGTDADKIQTSRIGVRTALISIPLRYMHTPTEMADVRDVENTARLMAALAKEAVVC